MSESPRTIGIFGVTGFIGTALSEELRRAGWQVVGFSRDSAKGERRSSEGELDLRGLDAIVNLAGESVAQRWTKSRWRRIEQSRLGLTRRIVQALAEMDAEARPGVFLNASAVGIYPPSAEELHEDARPGAGRLATLCRDWEAAAEEAQPLGVRVVQLRTGLVFGKGGLAWERMRKAFALGLGGRLGSGAQWMPWIHLSDELAAIRFALEQGDLHGPLNLSAPQPVTNRQFTTELARALRRPAYFHVPGFALRLLFGAFAEEALLASCRALPTRLLEAGFKFQYSTLDEGLKALVCREGSSIPCGST